MFYVCETATCCTLSVFPALICSPFVLDAFKRSYSNEDTATVAIPFFWDNFDKEGWSIWKSTYKFPEELKLVFMTSNLVSGMFQRLDKLRKYAFASVLILGENNNNQVEGIWVLRGQELAFGVSTFTFHVQTVTVGPASVGSRAWTSALCYGGQDLLPTTEMYLELCM